MTNKKHYKFMGTGEPAKITNEKSDTLIGMDGKMFSKEDLENEIKSKVKFNLRESKLAKTVVFAILFASGLGIGGKAAYDMYIRSPEVVLNAPGVYNPIKAPERLWDAYTKEKAENGFYHNQDSWRAYIERTMELNGGSLKDIRYTPDANHNGKTN